MTSCSIIIAHYESLPFLQTCISQIRKHANPNIRQHIIIADQSSEETHNQIIEWYNCSADITIVKTAPLWSGYAMDYCFRNLDIETDYVAQLHCDAFPVHKNWIWLCVKLIEENNLSFVGQLHFINRDSPVYPPNNPFFSMSPTFNVAKIETYKELSLQAGFTRFHNRTTEFHNKIPMDEPMTWANNDWEIWAKEDYSHRGSDDDTVAFHWQDKYTNSDKLGLAVTGYISPAYGRIIEDVVFHFGSCRESIGTGNAMGKEYKMFTERINNGYDDALIEEMVSLAKSNKPPELEILSRNYWNGTLKQSSPPSEELNKRIEDLKNGME